MPDLLEEAKRLSEVEALSREFHAIYQAEAKRQGDVRHHDDYDALSENIKEFDRILARYVLDREAELVERLEQAERVVEEFDAWLGAALRALGVKTIFDIPNYREHLQASIKDLEQERDEALAAQQREEQ